LKICSFSDIDIIITDSELSGSVYDLYRKNNITVIR